jgi:hypothetical protein
MNIGTYMYLKPGQAPKLAEKYAGYELSIYDASNGFK